jgi:hypothetical protein
MKCIVVFGAGKSATCLIDYLTGSMFKGWNLLIDADAETLKKKLVKSPLINPVQIN